ncbi:WAT1-related protein, partial [Mucuna pruriens]
MQGAGVATVMVLAQFLGVGLTTLIKASMSKGMSNFVFVAYSNLLAFCLLLLATTIHHRNRAPTSINNSIIFRIFVLSLLSHNIKLWSCSCVSVLAQTLIYVGLGYSSPTLTLTMEDLIPAYTFLIAIISGMEKLDLKLRSCQAKSIGTVISIAGALTVTLYKGFPITSGVMSNHVFLSSQQSKWLFGGFLLAIGSFCCSVLLVIQTWTIKDYPEELMLTTICCGFVVILSFIVAFIAEENPKAWILKPDMELICIFYSAIFVISTRSVMYAWACRKKGPVYVAMFCPLGIVIAIAMGVAFLGDTLYIGSMIGAGIIAIGFYAVIWGLSQEEKMACEKYETCSIISSSSSEVPLLMNKSKDKSCFKHFPLSYSSTKLQFSPQLNWILGGLYISFFHVVQASITKKYPGVTVIVFYQILFSTIQCAVLALIAVRDPTEWELKQFCDVYSKCGVCMDVSKEGGCIVIALAMGVLMIGAGIIAIGFYAVIWGQSKEEKAYENYETSTVSSCEAPLMMNESKGKKMVRWGNGRGNLLPFGGMVMAVLAQSGSMVVIKLAMADGVNKSSGQIMAYVGIELSSPTLASAMLNLIPAFTFVLALIFRMEEVDWRNSSSQAKMLGTIVSIGGAFIVILYKGPTILKTYSSNKLQLSPQLNWILGGIFCVGDSLASVAKKYPAVTVIVFFQILFSTIQCAVFALFAVRDRREWELKFDLGLMAILYQAIAATLIRYILCTWCVLKAGPLFCAMFKPVAIVFTVFMGSIFLGDGLGLGSLIGAVIIVVGFYAVLWGKYREENKIENLESSCHNVPLLQNRA